MLRAGNGRVRRPSHGRLEDVKREREREDATKEKRRRKDYREFLRRLLSVLDVRAVRVGEIESSERERRRVGEAGELRLLYQVQYTSVTYTYVGVDVGWFEYV